MANPVRWGSLVTDANGEIDYDRVRSLVAVMACCVGVAVALYATIREIRGAAAMGDHTLLGWIVTALVLPITGGTVAARFTGRVANGNGSNTTINVSTRPTPAGTPQPPAQ